MSVSYAPTYGPMTTEQFNAQFYGTMYANGTQDTMDQINDIQAQEAHDDQQRNQEMENGG